MSKIFITGISGMDGSNLTDLMLSMGHEVFGLIRRNSVAENQQYRLDHVRDKINLFYGDVTDSLSVETAMAKANPDYIFHLAAMSHVGISFEIPSFVMQTNTIGTLNVLEAYRRICPQAHFYFAGSSECFGLSVDADGFQRESTAYIPTSPYGISKVSAVHLVRHYRRAYNLFACVGLLFNHTGARRGSNFVCQKIVKSAVEIKLGLRPVLELGNLDSYRDFGNSRDYVRAMWMMLNHYTPDDFVIASGETHSIRGFCEYVFSKLNLNYSDYVTINEKFLRKEELPYLRGDASKAKLILDWMPEYSFEDTINEMIAYWQEELG